MSDNNEPTNETSSEGAASPERRSGGRPVLALVIIGLAAVFVAQKLGFGTTDRWWTVFVLVPAAWALVAAARFYRVAERWTPPAIGSLIGGILLMGLWAKLFFGGLWHGAAMHAAAWHGHGFHGHFLLPILLIVGIVFLVRRNRWRRG